MQLTGEQVLAAGRSLQLTDEQVLAVAGTCRKATAMTQMYPAVAVHESLLEGLTATDTDASRVVGP
jgi:hypothetical protein